jgi:hypothetical protein
MLTYPKRLLKFLQVHPFSKFTAAEVATVWKRSQVDVGIAVSHLVANGKLKVRKSDGVLVLKGKIGYDYA